jgi:hypothetical protein
MKIVQADEMEWKRGLEHRGGIFHNRLVLEGEPGTIDNFQLSMGRMSGAFYSPRHRHNFEQIRFQLKESLDFDRDGKMTAGTVGYFPEGVYYGPQTQAAEEEPVTIVLQFGGASGSGYVSRVEMKAGMDALSGQGEFKNGVFRRHSDVEGKRNMDGYQAIWEHVNGRAMDYPTPRYSRPFLMDPAAYAWMPIADGVAEKPLGTFTECKSAVRMVRVEAGAAYTAHGRTVSFVTQGTGTMGDQPLRLYTTLLVEVGERCTIAASETVELIEMTLPDLSALKQPALAQAAE